MENPSTSERTPLMRPPLTPAYVFSSATARERRGRLQKAQCFICSVMLLTFAVALIITISFNIENSNRVPTNDTQPNTSIALNLLSLSWPLSDTAMNKWSNPVNDDELKEAGEAGEQALGDRIRYEEMARSLDPQSPAFKAQLAMGATPPSVILAKAGYAKDYATRHFVKNKTSKKSWCIGRGPSINATWTLPECLRNKTLTCSPSKYRSINGTCNNLENPINWGVAFTKFRRVLPPAYADGVLAPRASQSGEELPSARKVSLEVHRPIYRADPQFTVVLAVWGQFLDHDITATALSKGANGSSISCCEYYTKPGHLAHPECFPVEIGPGDPNYDKYNVSCMEFVRSAPAPSCTLGPREQLNQATAFIDGSTVYGPYEELARDLRTFKNGELKMSMSKDGRELLPVSKNPNDGCNKATLNEKGQYCFVSGDVRANENLHLTTMHLLWARQHNRVVRKLHQLNPHWNDETLFQEARRILAAQMQHITYNEFLPVLLGPRVMEKLELNPRANGYSRDYNASLEPNIANHFASSAFRFAHTLLPTLMKVANGLSNTPEYVHLHKMLFNPYSLYSEGGPDNAMKGAMQTDMQKVDPYFTTELTSHLFKSDEPNKESPPGQFPTRPCGLDLVSLNIQRGRDHGLPSYPAWREHCGFRRPTSFDDLTDVMDPDSLQRISSIYKDIDDVDLYTASLSEVPIEDSVLGPTVTCLLVDQFVRLKRGDRYWYETPEEPQAFSESQLNEIRKTTLAGIICENGDNLDEAQMYVMRSVSADNPLVRCAAMPETDLRLWTEKPPARINPRTSNVVLIQG